MNSFGLPLNSCDPHYARKCHNNRQHEEEDRKESIHSVPTAVTSAIAERARRKQANDVNLPHYWVAVVDTTNNDGNKTLQHLMSCNVALILW
jgi:hypothetical protein